jgi:hypothetical protein
MHDKYGSVVRIGPRSISVSDKNMIKEVLAIQDLPKGSLYSALKSKSPLLCLIYISHFKLIL